MRVVELALVAWLLWGVALFLLQRRMIFPGRSAPPLGEGESLAGAELHRLTIPGGVVEAWWLPAEPGSARPGPARVFTHGNFEVVDEWVHSFEPLLSAGIGVLLLEYPGYGRSTGVATQASVTAGSLAAWDLLASMPEVDRTRIIALGRSVGGGAAGALSRERPLAALVFSSAFTSTRAYARRYLLPGFAVRHPLDNLAAVRAFAGPVLVQHGTRDGTVPYWHGERLAQGAADGELLSYDCGHNDCPWDRMMGDLVRFRAERGIVPRTGGSDGNPLPARGVR